MRTARLLALFLIAQLTGVGTAAAAPPHAGSFDGSFGKNGRVTLRLPDERLTPSDLIVQPDRKIVVAGTLVGDPDHYPGANSPAAVRFLPDGELDTGFGEGGVARVAAPLSTAIQGVALQPDGALLLSGITVADGGSRTGAVVRLLPSGRVDESFGSAGIAALPDAGGSYVRGVMSLTELGVQPDGRIVVAGSQDPSDVHSTADPYVARLMPNGALDTSFNEGGTASFGTSNPIAVLTRHDGSSVVVGSDTDYFGGGHLTLLRIDPGPDGFPFPHNPSNAFASHPYRSDLTALAARLRPDGTIDFVGQLANYRRSGVRRFLGYARIGTNLQLLEQGKVAKIGVVAAAFDPRGAVLTAGPWLAEAEPPPWQIERYREMRRLDRSFGDRKGKRLVHIDPPPGLTDTRITELTGLAMQGDRLIVAGYSHPRGKPNDGQSLALVRLIARQDGSGPRLSVRGLPRRRCLSGVTELVVLARDESRVTTRVLIDRHRLANTTRHRFFIELDTSHLKPGRHRLRLRSTDTAGNLGARSTTVRVCG